MNLKLALLFCLILIPFFGCQKNEKPIPEPIEIHEINIGILGGVYDTSTNKPTLHFYAYWKLNLLNDSFYIKTNPAMMGSPESITITAGRYPFNQDSAIKRFINEAPKLKDGQKFLHQSSDDEFYCFPMHIIQYREGKESKVFYYNDRNLSLKYLTELAYTLNNKTEQKAMAPNINLKDDSLVKYLVAKTDFESIVPVPPVQKAIKFTPPTDKK